MVSSVFQINWLKKLNLISYKLSKLPFVPSLYNKKFVKYKITPRDICQNRLKHVKSEKFELPLELKHYLNKIYLEDWKKAENSLSY